ncbi:alanine racemase, partial [Staphylococcus capitis]|uniref:alanine racemase n=1 Tax=Staphylococcus capitis TaxID=29388 RepID=UPI000D49BDA5
TLDEAVELRMHGINAKLLVLGVIPTADINKALQHRIAVTVPSKSWLDEVITNLPEENEKDQWFHVKLDTGMGRLGVKDVSEYKKIIETRDAHGHLIVEGVFTHFACADEPGDSMNQQQNLFEEMVNQARKPEFIHSQNSAGALM